MTDPRQIIFDTTKLFLAPTFGSILPEAGHDSRMANKRIANGHESSGISYSKQSQSVLSRFANT